jgi:acyl carrier protein
MNRFKVISIFVLAVILLLITTFFYGRYIGKKVSQTSRTPIVSSQTILERITNQYFLVTKTVYVNSEVEIETPKNNNWTDLFTGKKLTVNGLVRVDVGVEMKNMRPENINVDSGSKIVTISLPHAEILDASLSGELDIYEDKAVVEKIKDIFKNTQNEDYNLAMQRIISNAKSQVKANEEIFNQARLDSLKLVELIVSGMLDGYQVVIK